MMLNNTRQHITWTISWKAVVMLLLLCMSTPVDLRAREPGRNKKINTHPVIQFYQRHISGIDGNRCPMYPNCSRYCAQAIRKHGFGLGWIMACDRLLRCGRDEVRLSPRIRVNGRELTFDPVSANDFWWFPPKPSATEDTSAGKGLFHSGIRRTRDLNAGQP